MEKIIDNQFQDGWKKVEDNLKHFDKMMELIKKYPVKPAKIPLSVPYTIQYLL